MAYAAAGLAGAIGATGRALAAAVTLLTRLPVLRSRELGPDDIVRGAVLFPLVGAALGSVVGGTAVGLGLVLPALLAATLAVVVELCLTGALHVDGLVDSADGLAGRDSEQALAIMRDHSAGTYGTSALTLDLLAKAVALAALAEHAAILTVVTAFAVSRAASPLLAVALPYARSGPGTGRLLADRLRPRDALGAVTLAAVLAVVAAGAQAAVALLCLVVVTVLAGALARRRLGGVTGDVMGAVVELTATLTLVVAAGLV
ncbi:MAG TPA: adenosylcobinamide-GDP ribazoletransferase [Thermoleophilaceae bacterium]|nr:adenosylcobinamide-GDP ribazoletransferase [Thermoleophilaceae bacterium]